MNFLNDTIFMNKLILAEIALFSLSSVIIVVMLIVLWVFVHRRIYEIKDKLEKTIDDTQKLMTLTDSLFISYERRILENTFRNENFPVLDRLTAYYNNIKLGADGNSKEFMFPLILSNKTIWESIVNADITPDVKDKPYFDKILNDIKRVIR